MAFFVHVFASTFNDENHYLVLMAIASLTPMCYLRLPTRVGAFRCDFTRALFLTTCATRRVFLEVWNGFV